MVSTLQVNTIGPFTGTDITIETGKTITGTASQFKITGGASGQAILTDGAGNLTFGAVDALPTQSGQAGKFLKTDGTDASWDTVDALPSQTGQAGEYLQTDGTTATWEPVDSLPTQTGNENKFLTTDGTTEEWGPNTGKGYNNWNNVAVNVTTTVPADENAVVFGPITVTSPAVWTVNGPGILRVL